MHAVQPASASDCMLSVGFACLYCFATDGFVAKSSRRATPGPDIGLRHNDTSVFEAQARLVASFTVFTCHAACSFAARRRPRESRPAAGAAAATPRCCVVRQISPSYPSPPYRGGCSLMPPQVRPAPAVPPAVEAVPPGAAKMELELVAARAAAAAESLAAKTVGAASPPAVAAGPAAGVQRPLAGAKGAGVSAAHQAPCQTY